MHIGDDPIFAVSITVSAKWQEVIINPCFSLCVCLKEFVTYKITPLHYVYNMCILCVYNTTYQTFNDFSWRRTTSWLMISSYTDQQSSTIT